MTMANDNNPASDWSLDKRVPLALVLTILMQTAAAIWFFSGLSHQLDEHNRRLSAVEAQRAGERIAVVEAQVGDMKTQLNRIEGKLDKLAETQRRAP